MVSQLFFFINIFDEILYFANRDPLYYIGVSRSYTHLLVILRKWFQQWGWYFINLYSIGWSVINAKPGFNVCSGIKMFGGFGFFARQAVALKQFQFPPHSLVYLKVTFYK